MRTVRDHYERFLGPLYSWIVGDFEQSYRTNVEYFGSLDLPQSEDALAVDLGAGPGGQSLPLAEAGYEVLAVDFCRDLLDELESRRGDLPVRTVCADILDFPSFLQQRADLIVCMGDTLVHLPDRSAVDKLLDAVAANLTPRGKFIYAIRDYVDHVPEGPARFIPIRSEPDRIFTCFLDYRDDVVHVHDILQRRVGDGWEQEISDYLKLRLDPDSINSRLQKAGLVVESRRLVGGMITVVLCRD